MSQSTLRALGFEVISDKSGVVRFNAKLKSGGLSTWAAMSDIQTLLVMDARTVHIKTRSGSGYVLDVNAEAFDAAYRAWLHGGEEEGKTGGAA